MTDKAMDMVRAASTTCSRAPAKAGRASILTSPMPGIPHHWMPCVQVANVAESPAKAKRLGADIKVPAVTAPGVGRFAVFTDTQGASLGILRPE